MVAQTRKTAKKSKGKSLRCPRGYVMRSAYTRRYTTSTRKAGYTVKRASGTKYKVFPKTASLHVPATCIKNRGKPGKGSSTAIGPLKKGELTRFGYSRLDSIEERHVALRKAMAELGPLNIYHKLDAIAKLSYRIAPDASRIYSEDRDWVRARFGPLKAETKN